MEIVVLGGIGTGRGGGLVGGRVLPPALSAGFVAVKSVIAGELESFLLYVGVIGNPNFNINRIKSRRPDKK